MTKVLTVSIAAYNVEKYIRETLDSIVSTNVIDDIEILVIDDGGTDSTLSIAKEYDISVNALKEANNLTSNLLNLGQQLLIPEK